MKVAIHQLHYFPWSGYLDKMASVDKFILLDDVQLTDNSNMFRNKLLTLNGAAKYISIPFIRAGYLQKPNRQLCLNQSIDWQRRHADFLKENYKKAPFFNEVWEKIRSVFEKKYILLNEVTFDTILILRDIFDISTELVFQSNIDYPHDSKRNQLVLELCCAVQADNYLSGNGAKKYMEFAPFEKRGITIEFQNYTVPEYSQFSGKAQFIPGLSVLDMLFNIGLKQSMAIFRKQKQIQ